MAKSNQNHDAAAAKQRSDEQLKIDTAKQAESEEYAATKEYVDKRMEELDRRFAELEKREQESASRQQQTEQTMADRLRNLQAAAVPGQPVRRIGSGRMIQVKRGDWICYNTQTAVGSAVQGGWMKCSQDDKCSFETGITQIAIAKQDFVYDQTLGALQHQIKRHVVYKLMQGEHQQVNPAVLPEEQMIAAQSFDGIAVPA